MEIKSRAAISTKDWSVAFHSMISTAMRHITAPLLLESGIPINNVSELLGHASSVVTSRIYAHATKTGMARVIAATANLFQPTEAEMASN